MTENILPVGTKRPGYAELSWRKENKRDRYRAHSWFGGAEIPWTIYDRSKKKDLPKSKRYHAYASKRGKRYEKQFSSLVAAQHWCNTTYLRWRLDEFDLRTVQTRLSDAQLKDAEAAFAVLSEHQAGISLTRVVELWKETHYSLSRKPLRQAIDQFIDEAVLGNLRPRTKRERKNTLERLLEKLGDVEAHTIKLHSLEEFINDPSEGRVPSVTTRRNRRAVLHTFWEWMASKSKRYCLSNIVADLKKPSADGRAVEVLSLDEARRLFATASSVAGQSLVPYVALALFAGMRDEELARLNWSDVDLEKGQLTVQGRTSKTRAPRQHKLANNLLEILKRSRHLPIKPRNFSKLWRKVREQAGFNCSKTPDSSRRRWVEDLTRHSAISYWLKIEQDEGKAAYRFGNSANVIQAHYEASVSEEDARGYFRIGIDVSVASEGIADPTPTLIGGGPTAV